MARKKPLKIPEAFVFPEPGERDTLVVEGLRQNNLKNLTVRIPHNRITVVAGVSGSGKSSLAFDTLFAEGRWRFMESLSTYTRLFLERMDRPDLDSIRNIRPAIAVEQRNPVRTSRSTVGTATELNDYMRLFFVRVGKLHCPGCGAEVRAEEPSWIAENLISERSGAYAVTGFTLPVRGRTVEELTGELLRKGFLRIFAGEKLFDLSFERPETLPESVDVVTDRIVIKEEERARITDSLEVAYREGEGSAWVRVAEGTKKTYSRVPMCPNCGTIVERPTPLSLSFNHPVGACPECKGFGNVLKYDPDKVIPNKGLSLSEGAVEPWTKPAYTWWYEELESYAKDYGIDLGKPFEKLSAKEKKLVFKGTADFEGLDDFFEHLERKKYKLHIKVFTSRYKSQFVCPSCKGTRLKKQALTVKAGGLDISDVSRMTIEKAGAFFKTLELTPYEKEVSKEVLKQVRAKLEFLNQTGLGYITLDRLTKTLSGGEFQRVSIATQLASTLTGVLYILDEPSVGLHPVDIDTLIRQLKKLSSAGNTVVVVEHDPSMMKAADHILELGPGAGERGGRLVYSGPKEEFLSTARTLTSDYLAGREALRTPRWRRKGSGKSLFIKGASGNNLKDIDVKIPLRTFTCVTGVSGSGKSSLVVDTLYNALALHYGSYTEKPLPYRSMEGMEDVNGVKLVDQGPIGRTPRSNPITYIGAFDEIRRVFAGLPQARGLSLTQSHFSFNIPGGRCEVCKGEGVEKLEMYFLPDVFIRCGACGGRRYKPQVLDVKYKGKNIFDFLEMTFEEASPYFPGEPEVQKKFALIRDVGLGYLKLGQSALTLSGGEAQRLKIVKELMEKNAGGVLYIFDEPTTGLHMDDIKKLLSVFGRLVDAGSTVLVIEHNIDCIKTADFVIDLGPGGGERGGRVVATGTPEKVSAVKESITGRYLREVLSE